MTKKQRSIKIIESVLACAFIISFLCISFNLPLIADDFTYCFSKIDGSWIKTVNDAIASSAHEYMVWNGRFISNVINMVLLIDKNQIVFRLIMPIALVAISVLVTRVVTGSFSLKYVPLFLVLLFMCKWAELNQTVYWLTGFSNYVFPLLSLMTCMIPVSDLLVGRSSCLKYPVLWFLIGLLAGFSVEHYALIILTFELCTLLFCKVVKRKAPKEFYWMAVGTAAGMAALLLSPGMHLRYDSSNTRAFNDLIHWGYTRFIYCYFSLNQHLFVLLGLFSIIAYLKLDTNKICKTALVALGIVSVCISIELLTDIPLFLTEWEHYFLLDGWSYFFTHKPEMFEQFIVYGIEFLNLLIFSFVLSRRNKNPFPMLLALASLCGQAVFIISVKAVERAALISTVLLIVIVIICIYDLFNETTGLLNYVVWSTLIVYSLVVGTIYRGQYQIYKSNAEILTNWNGESELHIDAHDYKYVFRSDLDLNNYEQDMWIIQAIRDYYGVDRNVDIIFDIKE